MKIFSTIIIISLFSCSSPLKNNSSEKVKSVLTYRIDTEGNKNLEHLSEYDESGNVIYEEDYMAGEIYSYRWNTYDSLNNKTETKFSKCLDCEITITNYLYQNGQLIEKNNPDYISTLIYDKNGDCITEIEVFKTTQNLRRFKFMTYQNHLLKSKTSYDVSSYNILNQDHTIDSLINQNFPYYHYFENSFNDNNRVVRSDWYGSVSDWFQVQEHFYDEKTGLATKVKYSSRDGENGGERVYEYTFW